MIYTQERNIQEKINARHRKRNPTIQEKREYTNRNTDKKTDKNNYERHN
jgi:hypothetical protein